jgi:hypothetical protein
VPPFLPSASHPHRWPDHPRPSSDSIEIIPTTTAFHGSPPPQWPAVPPPPPSCQAVPHRPPEAAGATRAVDGHPGECLTGRTTLRRQASPPHRRQRRTVSPTTHHHARQIARATVVLDVKTHRQSSHRRDAVRRTAVGAPVAVTACPARVTRVAPTPSGPNRHVGWANSVRSVG